MFVPVVDQQNQPLVPTTSARARRWIESGKATPFWKRGVFCVRLNAEPSAREAQPIGIDPGSKREGFTVKSDGAHVHEPSCGGSYRRQRSRRNSSKHAACSPFQENTVSAEQGESQSWVASAEHPPPGGSGSFVWQCGWRECFRSFGSL